MREEGSRGTHGGNNRRRRHSLGQPWRKYYGKLGGGYGERGTHSRGREGKVGEGERGF